MVDEKTKLLIIQFSNFTLDGKHLAVDVGVTSTLRSTVVKTASHKFQHAAHIMYQNKLRKYANIEIEKDVVYQPFIIEEFGSIHKESLPIFNQLCEFIASKHNQQLTDVKFHYSKLLSSILTRSNSQAILARS